MSFYFYFLLNFISSSNGRSHCKGGGVSQPREEKEKRKKVENIKIGRKERISGVKFITKLTMVDSGEIS